MSCDVEGCESRLAQQRGEGRNTRNIPAPLSQNHPGVSKHINRDTAPDTQSRLRPVVVSMGGIGRCPHDKLYPKAWQQFATSE